MPTARGIPRTGRPPDEGALSSGGTQFDSIATLPSLSILHCPRPYKFGTLPDPTYPIFRILSSSILRDIKRVILILPVL